MELCPLERFSGVGLLGGGVTHSEASASSPASNPLVGHVSSVRLEQVA